jgi:hypothetical protein
VKGLTFRKTADAIGTFVKLSTGRSCPPTRSLRMHDLSPARFEAVVLPASRAHGGGFARWSSPTRRHSSEMAC